MSAAQTSDAETRDAEIGERIPTAARMRTHRGALAEVWMQRIGALLLAALVLLACLGVLGPRTTSESGSAGIGDVSWDFPSITRPGHETEVTVTFEPQTPRDTYELRIDHAAVATLGLEQIHPEPSEQTARGSTLVLQFTGSDADSYEVVLSGRVPVQQPPGSTKWSMAWVADGETITLDATTAVLP